MRKKTYNHFFIFVAFIAASSGILFGYDVGIISSAILFIHNHYDLTTELNGFVVSSVLFGAAFGAAISGRLNDYIGRKRLLIIVAFVFIFGTAMAASAPGLDWLVAGRIIIGIGIGVISYTAPLYISEIAQPKNRGALISINQLFITLGILLSYAVGYLFAESGEWRWMLALGLVPAVVLLVGMVFLPYSPRWLMLCGREDKALAILRRIRGTWVDVNHEFKSMQSSLNNKKGNWKLLFSGVVRPALVLGGGLALLQQVIGINTILYYTPTIFNMAGFHGPDAAILASLGVGAVFVLFNVVAIFLVDTLGRRPLLLGGLIGMAVCLGVLSFSFHAGFAAFLLRWITFASVLIYIACFAVSLGPILWLMISEIYPLRVRGLGASFATCANWCANLVVTFSFLTLVHAIGLGNTFFIYFIISLVAIWFVYYLLPETRGVSLENIEANLFSGKSLRQLGEEDPILETRE